MDSLYGGHQGNSFILKGAFKSYEEMVKKFSEGPNFTGVWFNEYCILDTPNKNDKDNGKIYRRGLNWNDSAAHNGAEYLGQIVGPSSGTPYMSLDTLADTKKQAQEIISEEEYEFKRYPIGKDAHGKYIISDNGDGSDLAVFNLNTKTEGGLVPGKYFDEEKQQDVFNDHIKYTWVNIRKDNADSDSWFYIGIENVYTVFDFTTSSVSQYDTNGNFNPNKTSATRDKAMSDPHPFYEKWNFAIPKGIKGDALRNLQVIIPTPNSKIYPISALQADGAYTSLKEDAEVYPEMIEDIRQKNKILVFDYLIYDKKENPEPIQIYLGPFKVIEKVDVTEDGTIELTYTHSAAPNRTETATNKIKWINSVSLTTESGRGGGLFTVVYNQKRATGEYEKYTAQLSWIKNVAIEDDGSIVYTYAGPLPSPAEMPGERIIGSDGVERIKKTKAVKWIKDVSLNHDCDTSDESNPPGQFKITFNNDAEPFVKILDWVSDIIINDDGTIILKHSTNKDTIATQKLKYITKANIGKDGRITFTFNTKEGDKNETLTLKNIDGEGGTSDTDFQLKYITKAYMNSDITKDQKLHLQYNFGIFEDEIKDEDINYIQYMTVNPVNYHLLVLYNAPDKRPKEKSEFVESLFDRGIYQRKTDKSYWVPQAQITWFPITNSNHRPTQADPLYWLDLGPIKDQAGVLIGFNITEEEKNKDPQGSGKTVIEYLNLKFPAGLTGEESEFGGISTKGKIITYSKKADTEDVKSVKEFYAFDYRPTNSSWYYLGSIGDDGNRDVKLLEKGYSDPGGELLASLNVDGILFTYESISYSSEGLPDFLDPGLVVG